jgi:hypothetical protein
MDVTKKIESLLSPEDLKTFEEGVESVIATRVEKEVASRMAVLEADMKKKYDTISEQYVEKKLESEIAKKSAELVEESNKKLVALEKKLVSRLGSFLDRVVVESISDEILEKVAINEVALPIVDKIRKVFAENFVQIDSDTQKKIDEAVAKADKAEKMLSESIAKNMELEERLEKSAVFIMISEKTQGLTPSQKKAVVEEFKGSSFDEVEPKIDGFVKLVKESTEKTSDQAPVAQVKPAKKVLKKKIDEVAAPDGLPEKKVIVEDTEEPVATVIDLASNYME